MNVKFSIYPLIILIMLGSCISVKKIYKSEVKNALISRSFNVSPVQDLLTEDDLIHLPEPIQKYLQITGCIGKPKVYNFKADIQGKILLKPNDPWMKVSMQQYNFFNPLKRIFFIKGYKMGIPMIGRDLYSEGKGNMLIKVAGIFKVADSRGTHMDQSALVTLLNDMVFLSPSSLIDKRLVYKIIHPDTIDVTLNDQNLSVSARLIFNHKGEIINFITDDRYYEPINEAPKKVRWSTPVEYKTENGISVPYKGRAIWHFEKGDFCYITFEEIKRYYNIEKFRNK